MRKALIIQCSGEAHLPSVAGQIDHCGICMPYWGEYPVCPDCFKNLDRRTDVCPQCKQKFEVE